MSRCLHPSHPGPPVWEKNLWKEADGGSGCRRGRLAEPFPAGLGRLAWENAGPEGTLLLRYPPMVICDTLSSPVSDRGGSYANAPDDAP
jgi:hypothetical protein